MTTQTCPRCGKPVIEVKDMGMSGKLFIHEYISTPLGPAPEGHRVSSAELKNGLRWASVK